MLTVSSLVEFLLSLLRDDEARAAFERDPESVLAQHGLDDLCSADVTDAVPLLADRTGVQVSAQPAPEPTSNGDSNGHVVEHPPDVEYTPGAVREINHVTNNYEVDKNVPPEEPDVYNIHNVDSHDQIINVDDRDATNIQSAGDVTIEDSFNQDNDAAIIDDSYNQDNDGLDNKGGTIDDSTAGGGGSNNAGDTATVTEDSMYESEVDSEDSEVDDGQDQLGSTSSIDVEEGSGESQNATLEHTSSAESQEASTEQPEADDTADMAETT